MTSILIEGAEGIFTGLPGDAMRSKGSIRIRDGRIAAIGDLSPEPGERRLNASGCVIYPGLVSTHHHLLQSVLKGVRPGLDSPLFAWLRQVPYRFWSKLDEEAIASPRKSDLRSFFYRAPLQRPTTITSFRIFIASILRMLCSRPHENWACGSCFAVAARRWRGLSIRRRLRPCRSSRSTR